MLKWQLLSELLNCSMKLVAVRSSCGAINDARLQCLEALKLAIKLQAPSQYVPVQMEVVRHGLRRSPPILSADSCSVQG